MGMNYYYKETLSDGSIEKTHIGKDSAGWKFTFHVYGGHLYLPSSPTQWFKFMEATRQWGKILDEYGREISPFDFWLMVGEDHTKYSDPKDPHIDGFPCLDCEFC